MQLRIFPWQKPAGAQEDKVPLNLESGFSFLAHPEKRTGEDAFFIEGNALGVFDGVAGTAVDGTDPRVYSQFLARATAERVREVGPENVVRALIDAQAVNEEIGASTACVVGLDDKARMFGINLGDSGVRVVRGDKVDWRTRELSHQFNLPYQLGDKSPDTVQMGQNIQRKVKEGDWLVVATDGLFDNVFDRDIVQVISDMSSQGPSAVAKQLGALAVANSQEPDFRSPFSIAAEKAGQSAPGGKLDDVTVIVARVVEDANWASKSFFSSL